MVDFASCESTFLNSNVSGATIKIINKDPYAIDNDQFESTVIATFSGTNDETAVWKYRVSCQNKNKTTRFTTTGTVSTCKLNSIRRSRSLLFHSQDHSFKRSVQAVVQKPIYEFSQGINTQNPKILDRYLSGSSPRIIQPDLSKIYSQVFFKCVDFA